MADPIPVPPDVLARMKAEKLAAAYRAMFGDDASKRTEIQLLVWEDLQAAAYANSSVSFQDRTGAICPYLSTHASGKRDLFLWIEKNVMFRPTIVQQQQK